MRGPLAGLAVLLGGIALCLSGDGYQTYLLGLVGVTALVGTGLNVLMGLAGQVSIGHVGFFAIGGYVTALLLDAPEDFFDDKVDRHISRLRVRNYPEQPERPRPGQLRAGAHADYGSLTILKAEAKPGGLEACNQTGEWVEVPIVSGTFVVNVGELMARWTNDRWPATLHRVVNPPRAQALGSRRQSIVFFHNPNYDAEIRCVPSCADPAHPARYPVTTSGEHLRRQFVRTQAY